MSIVRILRHLQPTAAAFARQAIDLQAGYGKNGCYAMFYYVV
jgi:hypothetical protein